MSERADGKTWLRRQLDGLEVPEEIRLGISELRRTFIAICRIARKGDQEEIGTLVALLQRFQPEVYERWEEIKWKEGGTIANLICHPEWMSAYKDTQETGR